MLTALGPNESFSTATSAGIAHAGVAARARAAAIAVERTAGTEARGRMGVSPPAGTGRRGRTVARGGGGVRPPLLCALASVGEGDSRGDAPAIRRVPRTYVQSCLRWSDAAAKARRPGRPRDGARLHGDVRLLRHRRRGRG